MQESSDKESNTEDTLDSEEQTKLDEIDPSDSETAPENQPLIPFCPQQIFRFQQRAPTGDSNVFSTLGSTLEQQLVESIGTHPCELCNEVFKTTHQLIRHKNTVHQDKFECSLCGDVFIKQFYLSRHKYYVHGLDINNEEIEPLLNDDRFECEFCDLTFGQKSYVTQHINRAHRDLSVLKERISGFKCEHCTETFDSYDRLLQHERSHIGGKPFILKLIKN